MNAKTIATYMAHASIQTTYDLYGKLMPGSEAEAAALVDHISAVRTPRRGSRRFSLREVDLFDFPSVLVGRIQLRWYRRCLYSWTHCLVEYH